MGLVAASPDPWVSLAWVISPEVPTSAARGHSQPRPPHAHPPHGTTTEPLQLTGINFPHYLSFPYHRGTFTQEGFDGSRIACHKTITEPIKATETRGLSKELQGELEKGPVPGDGDAAGEAGPGSVVCLFNRWLTATAG